ncbi:MAG: hypothetical protein IEMM0008_0327 [bacterium]|nr:MAG: hypothetical protein IEMM0008_0327 [bacterium]
MNKLKLILSIFLFVFGLLFLSYGQEKSYSKGRVYYLKIIKDFGEVSSSYSAYIKKNLEKISEDPSVKAVIIEIDTPGGGVGDAIKIAKYIKNAKYKTITFVNDSAFSAGAIISLSADYTVISKGGRIGDAYPIMMGKDGQPTAIKDEKVRIKILSGLRALVKGLAEKRQKRLIREISAGEKRYEHLKNSKSVQNLKKIFAAMVDINIELTMEDDGFKLSSEDLLTLTTDEAYKLGVVDGIYDDVKAIRKEFKLDGYELIELNPTTTDKVFSILTNPAIMSILMTLGMLGMVVELWSAGWGVPGTIGILALSLFFIGQISGNNPDWTALILFIVGIILIALELFVIPGFGIVGVAGLISIVLSFVLAFMGSSFDGEGLSLNTALLWVTASLVTTIVSVIVIAKYLPKTNVFSKIALVEGKILSTSHTDSHKEVLGKNGRTATPLRPSGIVIINDKRYDVVSTGGFIDRDVNVEVVEAEKGKIIVKSI